ncbi:hypothetical protein SAY87_023663 [Trapa incisa]|uniref:Uncharacterized protein n=1 Tax=Trapa incisa TaxID=236973 RepID=A0AAN7L737_9MYRT|nr:hypothetical protein SAY87_023663 [Trapa incisa]
MGDALFDLEQVLASKQPTPQEANFLSACKSKAIRDFAIGAGVGSGIVWAATRRLMTRWQRVNLTGGAAAIFGLWKFGRSLDSSVDHILSLDGSRMQKELANIIVKKYQDDPGKLQLMSKHFYLEEVFDDSTSDKPKFQWRYRSFFGDNITYHQSTPQVATESGSGRSNQPSHDNASLGSRQTLPAISTSDYPVSYGAEETKQDVRQSPMNPGDDMMGDPLDCVFGESSATTKEIYGSIPHDESAQGPATRSHRRSRRRRRRHQEVMGMDDCSFPCTKIQ